MGSTCSRKELTDFDRSVIKLCEDISKKIESLIPNQLRKDFHNNYGKITYNRDCGLGRGGGKLERDAITTRGRTGKAPFSNRNLRWHPLVVCNDKVDFAKHIESVRIGDDGLLIFKVKFSDGSYHEFDSNNVHLLPERYYVSNADWEPIKDELKKWSESQWNKNLCVIPALEACEWYDSVETYAVLSISIACGKYRADFDEVYKNVIDFLKNQKISNDVSLPSSNFPNDKDDLTCDPISKINIGENLECFRNHERPEVWKPNWITKKRSEGDDSSIQLMHLNPLVESEIRHKASNVRYGFRWSNIAMTDHSINEALSYFKYVVEHNKIQ